MSGNKITIGKVGRDVVGVGITGSGNIVGKHVNVTGGIHLSPQQLARLPVEYAKSLEAFSSEVSRQLQANQVPAERFAPIQQEVEALAQDIEGIKLDKPVPVVKKAGITTRVAAIAKSLLKILPQTAETFAAFTPLAPFSKLIGMGVDEVIKSVNEEG